MFVNFFTIYIFFGSKEKQLASLLTLMSHLLSKWRWNNQCVCKRGDMGGSDKYNRQNETIKAQLPPFPPSNCVLPYSVCVCVCVGVGCVCVCGYM